ncbi:hypothetical protein X739_00845 [Mesorhizobium sp. LNHC220B00]|uniref:DUF7736 domain-containing protein n=1 Tax=Mesorhizobium sp. LNHC229A00 TaxID=1287240 RepID=UPI0003CE68F4|nr:MULTISPECIES: hypothetical protein [unclassified Mesorhizobium]ESY79658.1 hypothetical protein X741_34325 [Mesorhizobium sp. LNHC229A00]ESY89068.1 hypothetical protein X739_00845 [Mesorhizobium sp. LNHC220B00]
MTQTKEFPTRDVLSTIAGVLISEIGGVYEVLNWMTGESVYTHQIPRISREATPVVLKMHPQLEPTIAEAEHVTPDNYLEWRTTWEERYGLTIAVPKMTIAEHERIDPISELAEKMHPDKIIVVNVDDV